MSNTEIFWKALEITVVSDAAEAIEFSLNELEALGTEINNLGKSPTETLKVIGYFHEQMDDEVVLTQVNDALRIYGFSNDSLKSFGWHEVENQDWLAEWKKHWKPTVTDKFIIAPPWELVENSDKIVIRIEPNMAFGTGTHETTKLCLRAIENLYQPSMSFFDLGTGTGILSIAVAKLKSQDPSLKSHVGSSENRTTSIMRCAAQDSIIACDTDEDSIKIARENAELNNSGNIDFYIGSISEETPTFDFVCANVTADVIVPLLPLLVEKADKVLVLSGILVEQKDIVASNLEKLGISDFNIETDGEWISMIISKI